MRISRESLILHQLGERYSAAKLGEYDAADGTAQQTVPTLSNDRYPNVTSAHEAYHRDLTVGTTLGFLEMTFAKLRASDAVPEGRRDISESALHMIVDSSWRTHESAALFCSIGVLSSSDAKDYVSALPEEYRRAYNLYQTLFSQCMEGETAVVHATQQLAKCISQAALNSGVLQNFVRGDLFDLGELAHALFEHRADTRQTELIKALSKSSIMGEILKEGAHRFSTVEPDSLTSLIQVASDLDEYYLSMFNQEFPELYSFPSLSAVLHERIGFFRYLEHELKKHKLSKFADQINLQLEDPRKHPDIEADGLLDSKMTVPENIESYQEKVQYRGGDLETFHKFVRTIRDGKVDTILYLTTNPFDFPLPVGDNRAIHPGNSMIHALPWVFGEEVAIENGLPILSSNAPLPQYFSFPTQELDKVASFFDIPQVVWARVAEEVDFITDSYSFDLKSAWAVSSKMSCSARDILDEISQSEGQHAGYQIVHWESTVANCLFVILANTTARTSTIYPVSTVAHGLLVQSHAFTSISEITDSALRRRHSSIIRLLYNE